MTVFLFQDHVIHPSLVPCRTEQGLNNTINVNPATFATKILHSTKVHHLLETDNKIITLENNIPHSQNIMDNIFDLFSVLSFVVINVAPM